MNKPATYAKHDPATAIAGLFRPLRRGERREAKLDISVTFNRATLRFIGFEPLGIDDEDVLLAVLAEAGLDGKTLDPSPSGPVGQALVQALKPTGTARSARRIMVTTTVYRIISNIGLTQSGGNYVQVKASLVRLANFQMVITTSDGSTQENLLAYMEHSDGTLRVAVNHALAAAILGQLQYVIISLQERRTLTSASAKALHSWLSATIRPGATQKSNLDKLANHVWGQSTNNACARKRKQRLLASLQQIAQLPGWRVTRTRDTVSIKRPVIENNPGATTGVTVTDYRSNGHTRSRVTPCINRVNPSF